MKTTLLIHKNWLQLFQLKLGNTLTNMLSIKLVGVMLLSIISFLVVENSNAQCSASLYGPSPLCPGATGSIVLQGSLSTSSYYQLYKNGTGAIGSSVLGSSFGPLTWSTTSVGSYYVQAISGPCYGFTSNTVTVSAASPGSISISPNVPPNLCQGNPITLTPPPPQNGSGYSWSASPSDAGATGSGAITVTPSVTTTYTLHGTEPICNTTVTASIPIQVSPKATQPTLSPSSTSFCQGSVAQTTFTAGSANASTFNWSLTAGAGSFPPTSSNTCTVTWSSSFTGPATMSVSANSAGSCSYTTSPSTSSVTINPIPGVPGVSNVSTGYNGIVTLSATGAGANETYKWYNNNSSFSGLICTGSCNTPQLTASTTYYAAKYNTSTGCETPPAQRALLGITVTCNSGSIVLTPPNSICPGQTGTLTLIGVDGSTSFQLYNGGGSTIGSPQSVTAQQPTIIQWTGLTAGSYYVRGATGLCSSYASQTVTVVALTPGSISISPNVPPNICQGNSITLTPPPPQSGSGYSWSASPSDAGATGSGAITVTPSVNTTYTLHGIEPICNTNVPASITVQVSPKATQPTLSPSSTSFCQGSVAQTTFTAGSANASSYNWSLTAGAGSFPPTSSNTCTVTWSSSFTGPATMSVSANSAGSCSYTTSPSTSSVTINALPSAPTVQQPFCLLFNSPATLTASGAGPNEGYLWYNTVTGGTAISTTTQNLTANATYYVTKYSTLTSCESARTPFLITVDQAPLANAGSDQVITMLGNAVLNGTVTDPDGPTVSYSWSQVSGPPVTIPNNTQLSVTINSLAAGNYVFRFTATDNCFSATDDVALSVISNNYNYTRESTVQVSGKMTTSDLSGLPVEQMLVHTTYYDGLGRPMQTVSHQASPIQTGGSHSKTDVVQPMAYDQFGREPNKYLPYVSAETSGDYKITAITDQSSYYQSNPLVAPPDGSPYTTTVFEPSPLNRPLQDFGPGQNWKDNNKSISHQYLTNIANEVMLFSYDGNTSLIAKGSGASGYYQANQLIVNKTTDEQGSDVIEYVDKLGHTVCKKVQYDISNGVKMYASTYYLYDDIGNLVIVLPPEATKNFESNGN